MRWQNKRMEPSNLNININQNKDKQTTKERATGTSMATAKDRPIGSHLNRSNSVGNARGILNKAGNVWQKRRSADTAKKTEKGWILPSFPWMSRTHHQESLHRSILCWCRLSMLSRKLAEILKNLKKYSSRNQGVGGDFQKAG